jgi:release factor glutamine methyltransferase
VTDRVAPGGEGGARPVGGRESWTIIEALKWTTGHLAANDIEPARLEAERLLSSATGMSRVDLYAQHDRPLADDERARYREAIKRRLAGEPLQYIVGEVAFRRIVLKVRPGVFIPRPETEVLVEVALECLGSSEPVRVLDLCTGTGAVALSIAREYAGVSVVAVDLSEEAVACARANAQRLGLDGAVEVRAGDLFEGLGAGERFALIVANPPYVPADAIPELATEVRDHEPAAALDGGPDGLDTVRRILAGAAERLEPGGALVMEVDSGHAAEAASLAGDAGLQDARVVKDLTGRPRIVVARAPAGV